MLRRRVDRTTRDLEWKCTKAEDQADLCMKKLFVSRISRDSRISIGGNIG